MRAVSSVLPPVLLLLLGCVVQAGRQGGQSAGKLRENVRTLTLDGSHARMHRRSGTLTAWRKESHHQHGDHHNQMKDEKPEHVHISFSSVHKLAANSGQEVDNLSLNFSKVSFELGEVREINMTFTSNITGLMFQFRADLHFISLTGMVAMAKEEGTMTLGESKAMSVHPGMLQILIKACHLPWHTLHGDLGDYLDLKFKIRESPVDQVEEFGRSENNSTFRRFLLGKDLHSPFMDVSTLVLRGNQWLPQVEGYPRPERGPAGEHLLAVRSQLPSRGCLAMVMLLEPGHTHPVTSVPLGGPANPPPNCASCIYVINHLPLVLLFNWLRTRVL